jgi:hypothetical protein
VTSPDREPTAKDDANRRALDVRIGTVEVEFRVPPRPPVPPPPTGAPVRPVPLPRFSPSRHYLRWG